MKGIVRSFVVFFEQYLFFSWDRPTKNYAISCTSRSDFLDGQVDICQLDAQSVERSIGNSLLLGSIEEGRELALECIIECLPT